MSRIFVIEGDETCKRISNRLNQMRKRNELVDFTLINHLGDQLKGHMVVMALSSPSIKSMVDSSSNERLFYLRAVSAEAMEQLISFMYIGEIEIDANTVDDILSGAAQLRLTPVEIACVDFKIANEVIENHNPFPISKYRNFG